MKCWICGIEVEMPYTAKEQAILDAVYAPIEEIEEIFEKREHSNKRVFCDHCKTKHDQEYQETLRQYWNLKNRIMLERAYKIFEKQSLDLYEYKSAFEAVEEWIKENESKEELSSFDSSEEVAAAVILIANEIKIYTHPKIAKYEVDFLIPQFKVVLEIDGEMFHKGKEARESRRDSIIRNALGKEWEIVRIPTKYIHQNIELLPESIKTIKKERRKMRLLSGDYVPETHS